VKPRPPRAPQAPPVPVNFQDGLRVWGDAAAFARALAKFMRTHADDAEHMRHQDATQAARSAHRLKGVAAQLGMAEVARRAHEAETRLKAGEDAESAIDALQEALVDVQATIRAHAQATPPAAEDLGPTPPPDGAGAPQAEEIARLLLALDSDNADRIDAAVAAAAAALPPAVRDALHERVQQYDFRGAEALLRNLPGVAPRTPAQGDSP